MSGIDIFGSQVDDEIRLKLLAAEQVLRKKQPEPWTKTKYRAYANFKTKKKEEEIKSAIAKNNARASPVKRAKKAVKRKNN